MYIQVTQPGLQIIVIFLSQPQVQVPQAFPPLKLLPQFKIIFKYPTQTTKLLLNAKLGPTAHCFQLQCQNVFVWMMSLLKENALNRNEEKKDIEDKNSNDLKDMAI